MNQDLDVGCLACHCRASKVEVIMAALATFEQPHIMVRVEHSKVVPGFGGLFELERVTRLMPYIYSP